MVGRIVSELSCNMTRYNTFLNQILALKENETQIRSELGINSTEWNITRYYALLCPAINYRECCEYLNNLPLSFHILTTCDIVFF